MSAFCSNQTSSRKFGPFKADLINFMILDGNNTPAVQIIL